MIPYGRQDINQEDIDAVVAVMRSDFLTQGPAVLRFEESLASYCNAGHAVACNSATSALHLACLALELGPGDYLWTTPITFVASANCGLYCGAHIDFVDVDPQTYNMSVEELAKKLEQANVHGRLPKIVVPVHLCGQPCDMAGIHALSRQYGFKIIEDASHGIGGKYQGQPIGDGRYSDITIFSFHPVKIITTGEGGAAVTNDPALAGKMALLRSHGITRDPQYMTTPPDGPWYYQQIDLGFNYRMTDLQAALGLSQMGRLDTFVDRRAGIARRYDAALSGVVVTPWQHPDSYSARHLYVVRVPSDRHRDIFEGLRENGFAVNLHYIPVHTQPYYQRMGFRPGDFPQAEAYYAQAISLPMFSCLTEADQDGVIEALSGLVAGAPN
jgi:UDP-4-amino-4,6-dideoxy-N-acetyl-beta-L-altrosamine transaminase